jgi:RNA polymerase sigma factor FliA
MIAKRSTRQRTRRDKLVIEHYSLVRRIAGRLIRRLPREVEFSDLVSAGTEGLIKAADSFDPSLSGSFKAYAEYRIRGEMLDELRRRDPLSRDQRRVSSTLDKHYDMLSMRLGRRPTEEEMAASMQISVAALNEKKIGVLSAEKNDFEEALGKFSVQGSADMDDVIFRRQATEILKRLIASDELAPRTREIINLYYFHPLMTLKKIATRMGITESRVCQIHRETLLKLRTQLAPGLGLDR